MYITKKRIGLGVVGVVIAAQTQSSPGGVRVELNVSKSKLTATDILFTKLSVTNKGEQPVTLLGPLNVNNSSLQFQIKNPKAKAFQKLDFPGQLLMIPASRMTLGSKESIARLVPAWRRGKHGQKLVFSTPGLYEIRAGVKADDQWVFSDDQRITVRPRKPLFAGISKDIMHDVQDVIQRRDYQHESGADLRNAKQLLTAAEKVGQTNVGNVLRWMASISDLQHAKTPKQWRKYYHSKTQLLDRMDAVTQETFNMLLLKVLVHSDQWRRAAKVLTKLDPSLLVVKSYRFDIKNNSEKGDGKGGGS